MADEVDERARLRSRCVEQYCLVVLVLSQHVLYEVGVPISMGLLPHRAATTAKVFEYHFVVFVAARAEVESSDLSVGVGGAWGARDANHGVGLLAGFGEAELESESCSLGTRRKSCPPSRERSRMVGACRWLVSNKNYVRKLSS
jgi:hypothetical protein